MKLKLTWLEFIDFAIEGLMHRGYEPTGFPTASHHPGMILPEFVEIEINKRKLPHEISIF